MEQEIIVAEAIAQDIKEQDTEQTGRETREETWIEKMIKREALPREARTVPTEQFAKQIGIPKSTYYWYLRKPEIQEKIIQKCINNTRKYAPDVLDSLARRAITDNKATEMYLKYVLQLAEKLGLDLNVVDENSKKKAQDAIKAIISRRNIGDGEETRG